VTRSYFLTQLLYHLLPPCWNPLYSLSLLSFVTNYISHFSLHATELMELHPSLVQDALSSKTQPFSQPSERLESRGEVDDKIIETLEGCRTITDTAALLKPSIKRQKSYLYNEPRLRHSWHRLSSIRLIQEYSLTTFAVVDAFVAVVRTV
jgi:hypothetical protein